MRSRTAFNAKRRLCDPRPPEAELLRLSRQVGYGGNPEHKRNPGDFGLTPPAGPRADKSLCDEVGIFRRQEALRLLREGIRRGLISAHLISAQGVNAFPQNVWAVTDDGRPLEAQLENQTRGTYHGYPMPPTDPLRAVILDLWSRRQGEAAGDA